MRNTASRVINVFTPSVRALRSRRNPSVIKKHLIWIKHVFNRFNSYKALEFAVKLNSEGSVVAIGHIYDKGVRIRAVNVVIYSVSVVLVCVSHNDESSYSTHSLPKSSYTLGTPSFLNP